MVTTYGIIMVYSILNNHSVACREAGQRGTSIYLPTMSIPMFPVELATDFMSLKQGRCCAAISVSVVLSHDGRYIYI
jgi:exoribonuclease R